MKEKTSRKRQAEQSKNRIYDAAISIFAEKGFDHTSINDICKKAGCSVGAFYHHFPTKDSILEETFRIADEQFSGWQIINSQDINGYEMIVAYMKAYAEQVSRISGLEFSKRFYNTDNKIFIRKGRSMQSRLIDIIQSAMTKGDISLELSAEEACDWLFIGARGLVFHWCLNEGEFDLVEKMEIYAKRALRGISI